MKNTHNFTSINPTLHNFRDSISFGPLEQLYIGRSRQFSLIKVSKLRCIVIERKKKIRELIPL